MQGRARSSEIAQAGGPSPALLISGRSPRRASAGAPSHSGPRRIDSCASSVLPSHHLREAERAGGVDGRCIGRKTLGRPASRGVAHDDPQGPPRSWRPAKTRSTWPTRPPPNASREAGPELRSCPKRSTSTRPNPRGCNQEGLTESNHHACLKVVERLRAGRPAPPRAPRAHTSATPAWLARTGPEPPRGAPEGELVSPFPSSTHRTTAPTSMDRSSRLPASVAGLVRDCARSGARRPAHFAPAGVTSAAAACIGR